MKVKDLFETIQSDDYMPHQKEGPWSTSKHSVYKGAAKTLKTLNDELAKSDPDTVTHQQRVAGAVAILAKKLKLSREQLSRVDLAALTHDLGKYGMVEILQKTGRLTPEEIAIIRTHPEQSAEIMKKHALPANIIKTARQHHMTQTGGYPAKDPGEHLDFTSQIVQVADIGDSLVGGTSSGHNYPMHFAENGQRLILPRTTKNVIRVMDSMAASGEINKEIYSYYRNMLITRNIPKALKKQLDWADQNL